MWKKKLNPCAFVEAFPGYWGDLYVKEQDVTSAWIRIGSLTIMSLNLVHEPTESSLFKHGNWKSYRKGKRSWSVSLGDLFDNDEVGQNYLRDKMMDGARFFVKFVPDSRYNLFGNRRFKWVGGAIVTNHKIQSNTIGLTRDSFTLQGVTPLSKRFETETTAASTAVCCESLHETLYMSVGETFEAPPAPAGTIGWVVDMNFQAQQTGTGDIGTITLITTGPGNSGCPVQVTYRYLCADQAFRPDTGATFWEQFIDIAENTANPGQIAILQEIQDVIGLRLGQDLGGGLKVSASDIYYEFNFVFLIKNPTFILDLSGLELDDLILVDTFTNLTGLDVSDNFLTVFDLEELDGPALVYLDARFNLIGQDNIELNAQAPTLVYLDLSFNFLNESYVFSSIVVGVTHTVDFYDISNNYLAYIVNDRANIKHFRMANNKYPSSTFLDPVISQDFWGNKINDSTSATKLLSSPFANISNTLTLNEIIDINGSRLGDGTALDEDAIILALATAIAAAQSITLAQATGIIKYDTRWSTSAPPEQYDRYNLPRSTP